MLVDSHCHLNSIDLTDFNNDLGEVIAQAKQVDVRHLLSVCVELSDYPQLIQIAERYENINISVGIHPNVELDQPILKEHLCQLAEHPKCIAIGETGLDYFRTETEQAQDLQRERFSTHIRAALKTSKPLIIHTRQAAEDTIKLMELENAKDIGGVMHCFAEDVNIAQRCLDLNFYISFSGILTFKNAKALHEVAKMVPLDRILIETDSPYLAPVPFRGKQNHPALVRYVAEALAELRQVDLTTIARVTTENFYQCFKISC